MKTLLTLFVLFCSSSVVADVGDVYYCETIQIVQVQINDVVEYPNYKFKFKRYEKKIEFGEGGYFDNHSLPVVYSYADFFTGNYETNETFIYKDNYFLHSLISVENKVNSIIAKCDVF